MQKLAFLVFAVFFALTTLVMAHATRDGPGLTLSSLNKDAMIIAAHTPGAPHAPSLVATVEPRASPVLVATATSSIEAGKHDLQRRVATGGATHNRTIVSA